jgi:hypothetical protein
MLTALHVLRTAQFHSLAGQPSSRPTSSIIATVSSPSTSYHRGLAHSQQLSTPYNTTILTTITLNYPTVITANTTHRSSLQPSSQLNDSRLSMQLQPTTCSCPCNPLTVYNAAQRANQRASAVHVAGQPKRAFPANQRLAVHVLLAAYYACPCNPSSQFHKQPWPTNEPASSMQPRVSFHNVAFLAN